MKMLTIGLVLLALALAWVGYRMDVNWAPAARVGAWLAAAGFVVTAVLGLLRRA